MDRMQVRAEYFSTFRNLATQLNTFALAGEWYRIDVGHAAGVTAEDAAAWANAGYTPEEAAPLIISGMTPEMASAGDPDTVEEGIARLADAGIDTTGVDLRHLP